MPRARAPASPAESSADPLRELEADGRRQRRRVRIVLFVLIPLVAAVLGTAWWLLAERAAEREIRDAWSRAAACLVGDPLGAGERPSLRLRAVQLAAVHDELQLPEKERWPSRCADDVSRLNVELREHGRDEGGEQGLAGQADLFAVRLRKTRVMDDVSQEVDALFEAARALGLGAEPVATPRPPPPPAAPLDLDRLPASSRITELQYTLDRISTTPMVDPELHLLLYDQRLAPTALLCTFTEGGTDRCRKLGPELAGKDGLALGGTVAPGALPLVLVGRDGEGGIYRAAPTSSVTAMAADSAYVAPDGYVAIASRPLDQEGRFELVQQSAPGAELARTTIEPTQFTPKITQIHRTRILWSHLLVQVLDADDLEASPRLQALPLPAADPTVAFQDITPLNWVNAAIFGCRTRETIIARVGIREGFVLFRGADGWSSPVQSESFPPAFSCDKGEAVFTGALGAQQRCTPAGCQLTAGVAPTYDPFRQRDGALADVGGRILAVALTDDRGGVRYRHAAGKNLADRAQDHVLLDDLVHHGQVRTDSTVLGMSLYGRGRFAVLLLSTPVGVYALRFDAQGTPSPANLRFE